MNRNYVNVIQEGKDYYPNNKEAGIHKELPPGAYTFQFDNITKVSKFQEFIPTCDNILDLPSAEYTRIVKEMEQFLNPSIRQKFNDLGFLYKRSALLHGLPGTGKTIVIQRIIKKVIEQNGIVLFFNDPRFTRLAFDILDDLNKNRLVLVIFEEFDGMIDLFSDAPFLSLLDGEIQKENIMYLATTNYINKIPKRLLRPGRFSSIIEIKYPTAEARRFYFESKLNGFADLELWVEKTEGLSVDELKEVIQAVYILGSDLDETISRIRATKEKGAKVKSLFEVENYNESEDDESEDDESEDDESEENDDGNSFKISTRYFK